MSAAMGGVLASVPLAGAVLVAGARRLELEGRLGIERERVGARAAARAGAGLFGAAAGLLLLGPQPALLLAALIGGWTILRRARERQEAALEADRGLRDAVRGLAASARAGLSIRRGLADVAAEGLPGVEEAFRLAADDLALGRPMPAVLDALSRRIGTSEGLLLTGVLSVHHRAGGDLPRALDEVADLVERRAEARRRARALTAQGRASGAVLAVLPVAFVGLLSGTSGNGLGTFYASPRGALLLALGIALQAAGFVWIRAILRRAEA